MNPHVYTNDSQMIKDVESLKRVDEQGYLYSMDISWNYYNLPKKIQMLFDAGCSAFATKNLNGECIFGRNYDYSHRLNNDKNNPVTGMNIIVKGNNPYAKYKSIGVADAFWLDWKNGTIGQGCGDDGVTDLSFFVAAPYLCMDGLNEAGLCLSILALPLVTDWQEVDYDSYKAKENQFENIYKLEEHGQTPDPLRPFTSVNTLAINDEDMRAWIAHQERFETNLPGLPKVLHPMLMRYILDKCATVDEAISLAEQFNVTTVIPGATYHIMVSDKTGKTVIFEWNEDGLIVVDRNHCTNYFTNRNDKFGSGYDRDDVIDICVNNRFKNGLREDYAEMLLNLVAQTPENGADRGKTQYSCIYNLNNKTLKIYSFGDFSKSWDFSIE